LRGGRVVREEEAPPEGVRHPGGERAGDEAPDRDVADDRRPVHDEVVGGRREAGRGAQPLPPGAWDLSGHVHFRMAFHRAEEALLGLRTRLLDEPPAQEDPERESDQHDHERTADELSDHELPAEQQSHDDAELEDEVRRGDLEHHRRREVRALAEERPIERGGRVGARRRRGAERGRGRERARRIGGQEAPHLLLRDDGLDEPGQREPEDQRPEDLPGHPAREGQGPDDLVPDRDAEDHEECAPSGSPRPRWRRLRRRISMPATSAAPTAAAIAITTVSMLEPEPPPLVAVTTGSFTPAFAARTRTALSAVCSSPSTPFPIGTLRTSASVAGSGFVLST